MSGHELAAIALTGFVVGSLPGFMVALIGVRLYGLGDRDVRRVFLPVALLWLTIATVAALYWTTRMIGA